MNSMIFCLQRRSFIFNRWSSVLYNNSRCMPLISVRSISSSRICRHGEYERRDPEKPEDIVKFTVVDREGNHHSVKGKKGDNLLYLMHRFQDSNTNLALEGACEASLACSTCHVIVSDEHYDLLQEPEEEEDDMLDMASCLTSTSRLGCQIILDSYLDGMQIELPLFTKNFYVDGHTPTPH